MLDFDSVQSALEKLGAMADASESHGTLCGLLLDNCGLAVWLQHSFEELPDAADVLAVEQLQVLKQLFEQTRTQLNTEDLSFELLLPDDIDDFSVQLLGLSTWCQGFLYGYGVIAKSKSPELDEQSQECLSDLLEISQLNYDEEVSQETEGQYLEVVEHIRISVLILNEAINPVMPAPLMQ